MSIETKTKKWGNSLGIIIPNKEVENLKLKENQTIRVDIHLTTVNPLKELFGSYKSNIPTEKLLKDIRKEESKWI